MKKYFFESIFSKIRLCLIVFTIVFVVTGGFSNIKDITNLNYLIFSVIVVSVYVLTEKVYFYIKNRSYKSEHDYYRELPRNYSPSIVSFLTNLKVEYKKDVLSDLIYLEQKKVLKIDKNNNIIILNNDYVFMNGEEHLRYIVNEIKSNDNRNLEDFLNNKDFHESKFRKLIIQDSFALGLLTRYSMQIFGIVILLIAFFAIRIFSSYSMFSISSSMNGVFSNGPVDTNEFINSFINMQNFINTFRKTIPMFFIGFVAIMMATKIIPIIRRANDTDYMRSKQGKKDMGLWLSYSRFIKDFSIIEERDYEEKNLWGYYFAYGLALGINKKVMKKFGLEYERFVIK